MKRLSTPIVGTGMLATLGLLAGCAAGQSGALGNAPTVPDRPASSAVSPAASRTSQPEPTGQKSATPVPSATSVTPVQTVTAAPTATVTLTATPAPTVPAITVQSPANGARVTSPVTVSGTADVFEGVVSVRIVDAAGHEIARTFTTASCGTGCRGDYSVAVKFTVSAAQKGAIEVFETSAKDGSAVNLVRIPVTLAP